MQLILLRHEDRFEDPTLLTELTKKGKTKSKELVDILSEYKIDSIYSSPFIRTLQTINHVSTVIDKQIRVDNGLYEYMIEGVFKPHQYYGFTNKSYYKLINTDFNVDPDYKSMVVEPVTKLENDAILMKRVNVFLTKLMESNVDKTVLLVSHLSPLNAIIRTYDPSHDLDYPIPMGGLHILNV